MTGCFQEKQRKTLHRAAATEKDRWSGDKYDFREMLTFRKVNVIFLQEGI